jgi:hypothetical protein
MIDTGREKELTKLFDEYKNDLKRLEKLLKQYELPSNFGPVLKERMEQRVIGKALRGILYRDDDKEIYAQKAETIKAYYDCLRKQGFDHMTAITIICDTEGVDEGILRKETDEGEEEAE